MNFPNEKRKKIMKRPVWADNLLSEFTLIQNLVPQFPFVAMDTEFPGVFFQPATVVETPYPKGPDQVYEVLRANVDVLNLIQVGLTLSDADGNLPHHRWDCNYIWEFNFRDFDIHRDLYAPDSIKLLQENGINFEENRLKGICSIQFAELMMSSGILFGNNVTWVTFHGAYDFAYLLKILIHHSLPRTLKEFMELVSLFFGENVYDVKYLMKFCDGLYGGLERLGKTLGVDRAIGQCHQAGSDSLLTSQSFFKLEKTYFNGNIGKHARILYGLNDMS